MAAENDIQDLVCVEPAVGDRITALLQPAQETSERELLEAHVEICAACRTTLELHRRLERGFRDGVYPTRSAGLRSRPRRRARFAAWAATASLAASVVFLAVLPPRPSGPTTTTRGDDTVRILRPVEGQVVTSGDLEVAWTPVEGASSYRVQVEPEGGDGAWSTTVFGSSATVPGPGLLDGHGEVRVVVTPTPADLLPPGALSVSVETAAAPSVVLHRVRRAQPIVLLLAAVGIVLATASALDRRRASAP